MITVQHSEHLLDNDILTFTTSKEELSFSERKKLENINIFNFKFSSEVYSFEKKIFFKIFSELLIKKYNLYFFYVEKIAEKKSKVRSFKKLMYPHKKEVGKDALFEFEVEFKGGRSLLYSVISINILNVDYVCDQLLDSRFSFAYLGNKNNNIEKVLSPIILTKYVKDKKTNNSIIDLNILKVIQDLVDENASIIKRSYDGKDNTYLSVFYKNEAHIELMKKIKKKIRIMNI